MGMTKEQYEEFSKARLSRNSSVEKDDDLFGELDLSINKEDSYIWSIVGQCWLLNNYNYESTSIYRKICT